MRNPRSTASRAAILYGVVAHLDRLQRLGVNALTLNPVFTSASNHRYHTDDYDHVDPLLGGNEALRELLDEAHVRGMRVRARRCLQSLRSRLVALPSRGRERRPLALSRLVLPGRRRPRWLTHAQRRTPAPAKWPMAESRAAGAAFGAASRAVLGYEAWWDLPALPKLNLDEPHLREYILGVSERWIRFGIDGWRLDVAEEVGADFWREFRARVRGADPDAYLVAGTWHHKPEWLQGDMFDAYMNYPLALGLLGFAAQEHLDPGVRGPGEYEGKLWCSTARRCGPASRSLPR